MKFKKNVLISVLFAIIVSIVIIIVSSGIKYINTLETQIEKRDSLIINLIRNDTRLS